MVSQISTVPKYRKDPAFPLSPVTGETKLIVTVPVHNETLLMLQKGAHE